MRKRALIVIGSLLFCLSQIGVNYLIYKYKNKNIEIPRVELKDKEDNDNSFAIMLEQDDGSYTQTSSNTFNQPGYTFNSEKSGCIDVNGNKIANSISYNESTKAVIVSVSSTSYCYVYFDKVLNAETLALSGELWSSGLEGDGYRYTGTNPDNYICFGTTDKKTCTGDTDKYMYRIIGVFESGGKKYMKLIKKEALNTAYRWHSSYTTDTDWGSSELKANLNGSYFLENTTYVPDSTWKNRIADWIWNTVNTKTYESSGPNYYDSVSPSNMYLHENNKSGAPSGGVHGTLPNTKIGLMYASDYALSLGSEALSLTTGTYTNREKLKTGWMHLSNNDSVSPNAHEWTISRYGYSGSYYNAWRVYSNGYVHTGGAAATSSARPVFYLSSNEVIASGTGTLEDPYILGA